MKTTILILFLFCTINSGHAQLSEENYASTDNYISPLFLKNNIEGDQKTAKLPGERMRNTGTALIVGGIVLEITGIGILSSIEGVSTTGTSINYQSSNPKQEEPPAKLEVGLLAIVGGIGMIIPGIILAAKGSKKYNNSLKEQKQLSLNMKGTGLSLRLKF